MSDDLTRTVARYAIEDFGEIDPRARQEAVRRVLDSVGVAIGALDQPGPQAALRYARRHARPEGCRIWGTDLRASPEVAALVNGVAIRCLDWNDAFFGRDSTHPSDMLGGLIAVAEERGRTGAALVTAIVVGYEVSVAFADALGIRRFGWDHVNVTALGACAGTGRLMGLDAEQMEHAIALTVVPHAAMLQTRHGDLSMWKGFAAPDAVRHAIYACELAEFGVEGPFQPFEGGRGLLALLLDGEMPAPEALVPLRERARPRRIGDTHLKAWPLGYVSQSAVAAALEARGRLPEHAEIDRINVATYRVAVELMGSPEKWRPTTRETADHSLPYVVSAAVADGDVTEDTFADSRVSDPAVHAYLRDHITLVEDPELTKAYPASFPARVEVVAADGRTEVARVDHPPGHAKNPLSDEALDAKFESACGSMLGIRTEKLRKSIRAMDDQSRLDDLVALLSAT